MLSLPTSVNWVTAGAVTSIKQQGGCRSCYTFASAGAVEGIYKIKKGSLIDFSTQQLLDCSTITGNTGCSGGYMTKVWDYLKTYKLTTWANYPYVGSK